MKKQSFIFLLMLVLLCIFSTGLSAFQLDVYKLPDNWKPSIDGDDSEWFRQYFTARFDNINNLYCVVNSSHYKDASVIGSGVAESQFTDYQCSTFMAWDDTMLYVCWKTTVDDKPLVADGTGAWHSGEYLKICLGGTDNFIQIWNYDGGLMNPAAMPKIPEVDVTAGDLPVYEFRFRKVFLPTTVNFMIEDVDKDPILNSYEDNFLGLKGNYTGDRTYTGGQPNQWEDSQYFPSINFIDEVPEGVSIEKTNASSNVDVNTISVSPNPFNPSTVISYNAQNKSSIKIFDINGKVINSFSDLQGNGKINWAGKDMNNSPVSAGVYVVKLLSKNSSKTARVVFAK